MIDRSWRGLRVLVLSPTPTDPLDFGNRKRIHTVCTELRQRGAEIHFVHYASEADWRQGLPLGPARVMSACWDSLWTVAPTRPLHMPPEGSHHLADEWWDPAIGDMLRWLFSAHAFDVLIVNYTWLSKAFDFAPRHVLRVLDTHDRFTGRRELLEANGLAAEFFYMREEEERLALARADVVWAIKPQEAVSFARLVDRTVLTMPHAERIQALSRSVPPHGVLRFGIVGARNSINLANIRAFIDVARTHVERTLLPCEFHIAGSCCDDLGRYVLPSYVWLRGRMADLNDFYRDVDVVLAPMTFSTGLKIKVGEALHLGKALIAHEHAFEGYPKSHDFHTVPSFEAMLAACREVVKRPDLIAELEDASIRSASETFRLAGATLDATAEAHSRLRPGVIVVIALADAVTGSLRLDHACEVAQYLGWLAPVHFLLHGPPGSQPDADALGRIAALGEVVVAPSLAQSAITLAPFFGVRVLRERSLRALSGEGHRAIWFASPPEASEPLPQHSALDVFLSFEAMMLGPSREPLPDLLQRLARSFHSVILLSLRDGPKVSRARGTGGIGTLRVPMLFKGHQSLSVWALDRAAQRGIAILADAADDPLMHLALDTLRSLGAGTVQIVLPIGAAAASPDGLGTVDPTVFIRTVWTSQVAPALVLDTGADPSLDGLREVLDRCGVARISLFRDAGRPQYLDEKPRMEAAGIYASIERVRTALRDPATCSAAARTRAAQFVTANDPGWALIWRRVQDAAARR